MSAYRNLASLAVLTGTLTMSGTSDASNPYPTEIQNQLGLNTTLDCRLCHQSIVGRPPANKPFALTMKAAGLRGRNPALLAPALTTVAADGTDSDGDGVGDIDELRAGTDPNVAEAPATDAAAPSAVDSGAGPVAEPSAEAGAGNLSDAGSSEPSDAGAGDDAAVSAPGDGGPTDAGQGEPAAGDGGVDGVSMAADAGTDAGGDDEPAGEGPADDDDEPADDDDEPADDDDGEPADDDDEPSDDDVGGGGCSITEAPPVSGTPWGALSLVLGACFAVLRRRRRTPSSSPNA